MRTLRAANNKNEEEQKIQAQRRLQHQRYDDLGKKMEQMKKSHEIELRTLKKTARKAGLDFFKQKSEHVMRVFKQEQMYMVDEYF